ncbi:MAG: hypothetical protein ACE15E_24515, partial [Acidobacteriota bacterium]
SRKFKRLLSWPDSPESGMPAEFEPARNIYRLYGKADYLSETLDLPAFVQGRYEANFAGSL